jgi:hypothetical protein
MKKLVKAVLASNTRSDRIRINPKVKLQIKPIQTKNCKNRILVGCIWMTFIKPRTAKPQTPRLIAKTALSFYYMLIPLKLY